MVESTKLSNTSRLELIAFVLPVIVVAGYSIGRGVGNVLLVFQLLFAIYYLWLKRCAIPSWSWVLVLYLLAPLPGLFYYGVHVAEGFWSWGRFVLTVCSVFFLSLCLNEKVIEDSRARKVFGFIFFLTLVYYGASAAFFFSMGGYKPAVQISGLHVAALFSLGLIVTDGGFRRVVFIAVIALVVLSVGDSRSEIMVLLASCFATLAYFYRRIIWIVAGIPAAFLLAFLYGAAWRNYSQLFSADWNFLLNGLTGKRFELWELCFVHPPNNMLTGVGFGQSAHYFRQFGYVTHSFHNAFLETWYDGGWLWLSALCLLVWVLIKSVVHNYYLLVGQQRWVYSCFFGGLFASVVACSTDRGYITQLFSVFLFYCLFILRVYDRNR